MATARKKAQGKTRGTVKKSKLKKIIQTPLRFHHQDIHERFDELQAYVAELKGLLMSVIESSKNES